jgi:glycosyltransferase involved in cell wall biosynthesis
MYQSPFISICIPTYNQTIHLRKLLNSVFNQKDVSFEVIVSDDSSTDDVSNLIKEFSSQGKEIRYYKNCPSLGAPKNWNFCMSQAKGDYIKIMHHDEWFENDYALMKLLNILLVNKETFVFSAASKENNTGNSEFRISQNNLEIIKNEPENLILANLIGGPSAIMYHKDANIQFDENIIWLVDVEFYLQLFRKGYSVAYLDEILYTSMIDADSLTNDNLINSEKQLSEYSFLYNKYVKKLSFSKRLKYIIGIYKILILPLKKKYYFIQFVRFLKRI